jgi:predicted RNA-binding protein
MVANAIWSEQPIGGAPLVHQVLWVSADRAAQAKDGLNEQRRFHEATLEEPGQSVKMADVVALELEAGAVRLADVLEDVFDVGEGVLEDQFPGAFEERLLPVVLPLGQAEVDRAHVERGHLRLQLPGGDGALVDRHVGTTAAGGDVHHHVALAFDALQEAAEDGGIARGLAIVRVARMQVHDGGAGGRRVERLLGDFLRGDRQVGRHGRGVSAAGDGASDDDFLHGILA